MTQLNISISTSEIQSLLNKKFKNSKIRSNFNKTLAVAISNINDGDNIIYDLTKRDDSLRYLEAYLNATSRLLFSLNAFLIETMLEYAKEYEFYDTFIDKKSKKIPPPRKNIEICDYEKNQNTVSNLITFFVIKRKVPFSLLHSFIQYEMIFRNQYAHGWPFFFYAFLKEMHKLETDIDYSNYLSFNPILKNKQGGDHKIVRKELKEKSLKYKKINLTLYIDEFVSLPSSYQQELFFNLKFKYREQYIIELKKYGINPDITFYEEINGKTVKKEIIDMQKKFRMKERKNSKFKIKLSLNHLAAKICTLVNELDSTITTKKI